MKNLIITLLAIGCACSTQAQDFNKYMASARSSYSAKKLDDSRFAMQQMLQELDVIVAKDILKLLPVKMDALNANLTNDNVNGASGFGGIIIEREYATGNKTAEIQIIGHSPLMASVNAILALPFVNSGGNRKTIKLEGYKALLEKISDSEADKISYQIQLPLNSSLFTLKTTGLTAEETQQLAATIPVAKLAGLIQ